MKTIILSFLIVFISNVLIAQSTEVKNDSTFKKNSFSFFVINELSLAYAYSFTQKSALRFNVRYSQRNSFQEYYEERDGDDIHTLNIKNNTHNLKLDTHFIYSLMKMSPIDLYVGIGPTINFTYQSGELSYAGYYNNTNTNIWKIGPSAIVGVKSRLNNYFSIFAEYFMAFLYTHNGNERYSNGDTFKYWNEGNEFIIEDIKLGLTVNF